MPGQSHAQVRAALKKHTFFNGAGVPQKHARSVVHGKRARAEVDEVQKAAKTVVRQIVDLQHCAAQDQAAEAFCVGQARQP